ncbi:unnamed protein product [Orchesella dallaii]|uniref:Uncharacterized protein n=1 Tax=Orchesella dallaii TaxID=48710 RepID=A0ABP1RP40_9HEXA
MERWQVCGRLASNCLKCVENNCFFIQFETNEFTCVDKLNGWSDIQRIMAPSLDELCERLSTEKPLVANSIHETGFYILCMRDRRIFLAISGIPSQISTFYNDHSRKTTIMLSYEDRENENVELYHSTNPSIHSNQLALGPPPRLQQEIELETIDESLSERSSPESSPEVMAKETCVTKFNRIICKPTFFQS